MLIISSSAVFSWQSRTGTIESGSGSHLWYFLGSISKTFCYAIIQQLPSYSSLSLGLSRTIFNSWKSLYEFGYHIIPNSCIITAENYSLLPNLAYSEHSESRQPYSAHFSLAIVSKKNLHLKLHFSDLWHNNRPMGESLHSSCVLSRLHKQKDYFVQRVFVRNIKIHWIRTSHSSHTCLVPIQSKKNPEFKCIFYSLTFYSI